MKGAIGFCKNGSSFSFKKIVLQTWYVWLKPDE